jgi:U3 small nucleolar RNA-associated protein 18
MEDMDVDKSEDELELERLVFGDTQGIKDRISGVEKTVHKTDLEHLEDDQVWGFFRSILTAKLFFIDQGDKETVVTTADEDEDEEHGDDVGAAWHDSDDETLTISLAGTRRLRKLRRNEDEDTLNGKIYTRRLRQQFERIYPVPEWASAAVAKRRDPESDDEDDVPWSTDPLSLLFQSSAPLTQQPTMYLPDDILAIAAVAPIPLPSGNPHPRSIQFHPSYPLLLITYQDNTLRIHSIDGKVNPLATSLKLSRLKIQSATFHPTKNIVYISTQRRQLFLVWNLISGAVQKIKKAFRDETLSSREWTNLRIAPDGAVIGIQGSQGWITFLEAESGQVLGDCKVDGTVVDYCFSRQGKAIILSQQGEIWEYNLSEMRISNRWRDEGGVSLTRLVLSPDDRFLIIGSTSGILTIYDLASGPTLLKTLYNLTTPITSLSISPDGQLVVAASNGKRDQLRAIHLPSTKVFPNWPTSKTPIGQVECASLGRDGYLAIGRTKGVGLWRVRDM